MAEEICQNANKWTLEGDSKLLEFMEKIAKKLENHAENTKQNLRRMELSLDDACISLGNTTNKFHALQHSQFVENRVCEEDEIMTHRPIEVKSLPELNDMDSLQSAIDNGIFMLNKCYEKVPLDLDDSDEEDDPDKKCHFFRPKDPYLDRATPFVIGSKEWKEKWHIGLVESEDESEEEVKEEFSDSSDGNSLSVSLNVQTISESDGSLWEQDRIDNQSASPESIQNVIQPNPSTSKNVRLFPDEPPDDSTMKKQGLFDDSDSDNESLTKTQSKAGGSFFREQKVERKTVNLFDDEPPELDFVPESSKNKPTNLFAESEDDDESFVRPPVKKRSIFDEKPPPADDIFVENKISQPKKKVNLFDEDEFFSYIQDIKDKPETKPVQSKNIFDEPKPTTQKKISNLFSDDVEDDLFDSIIKNDVKPLNEKKAVPVIEEVMVKKRAYVLGEDDNTIVKKIPTTSIFDDLPPEDDFDIFRTNKSGKSDKKKTNLFEDLSDEDSINNSSKTTLKNRDQDIERDIIPSSSKLGSLFNEEKVSKKSNPKDSLFGDEPPEDDLFSKKPEKKIASKGNLFSEESSDEVEKDIFSNVAKKILEKPKLDSLFGDEPPEDDLFSTKVSNSISSSSKLGSLFGDESPEEDLFSTKIRKEVSKPSQSSSLFSEKETKPVSKSLQDDTAISQSDNEVSNESPIPDPSSSSVRTKRDTKNVPGDVDKNSISSSSKLGSLFGDESPEEDLFSTKIRSEVSKPLAHTEKDIVPSPSSSLFSAKETNPAASKSLDDMNEGTKENQSPGLTGQEIKKVSIPSSSTVQTMRTTEDVERNAIRSSSKLGSLFSDEPPEEDLFSTKIRKEVSNPLAQIEKDIVPSSSLLSEKKTKPGSQSDSKEIPTQETPEQETKNISNSSSSLVRTKRDTKDVSGDVEKKTSPSSTKLESLFSEEPPEEDLFSTNIQKEVSKPLAHTKRDIVPSPLSSLLSEEKTESVQDILATSKSDKVYESKESPNPQQPEQEIKKVSIPSSSSVRTTSTRDTKDVSAEVEKDIISSTHKLEGLFSDEPPEEDLFSNKVSKPENSLANSKAKNTPSHSLFSETPEVDVPTKESPSASKLGSLFSDESSEEREDDIFSKVSPTGEQTEQELPSTSKQVKDDSFSKKLTKALSKPEESEIEPIPVIEEVMVKKRAYRLGEDDNTIVKKIPTTSIFDDLPPEDDFDIFRPVKKLPNVDKESPATSEVKVNENETVSTKTNKPVKKLDIGERREDDLFPSTANSPLSKSSKTNDLFSFASKLEEPDKIPTETKTPIVSPQFNFLNEEPPPDPEIETWSSKTSYSTPSNEPSHIERSEVKPNQSALNYPSIGLFDDLPPDDDDVDKIPSMPYTKTSHVYYDDTDLFLTATNPVNISPNLDLLNEEPPPVDEIDFKDKLNLFSTPENKIIEKEKIDVPIKVSVSDLIQARSETKPIESPKKKIQPNKLNKNLSINVAALLPGAKRPSLKAVINEERISPDGDSENVVIETTPKFNTPEATNPDILPSLSKSRAKIQVKRRPSTRRGRQENYRKSVHMNEEETSDEIDANKNKLVTKTVDEIITTPKTSHEESTIFKKVDFKKRESSASLKRDNENNEKESLFSSDDDDPLFGPVGKKTVPIVKPDLKPAKSIEVKPKNIPVAKTVSKTDKVKKNEKSIFGSDDDEDDLFGKPTQKVKSVKTVDKNKNNLFGESEDDGEDIFAVKKPKGSTTVKKDSSKVDKKLTVSTSSSSLAGSDPLADLLNK